MRGTKCVVAAAVLLALWCSLVDAEDATSPSEIVQKAVEAEAQSSHLRRAAESHSKRAEALRQQLAAGGHAHGGPKKPSGLEEEVRRDHAETLSAIRGQQEDDLQACQGNLRALLRQQKRETTRGVPDMQRLLAPQVTHHALLTCGTCHQTPFFRRRVLEATLTSLGC